MNNIFVLCTGRCGSKTMTKACQHATNYTAAHESVGLRHNLMYPSNHIEVNNRLVWYMGLLQQCYPDARYVWLLRDHEATALSYAKKKAGNECNIIRAWRTAIRMGWYATKKRRPDAERSVLADCREYVAATNSLIQMFMKTLPDERWCTVFVEEPWTFDIFWNWAGLQGDKEAAFETFMQRFNANEPGNQCDPNRTTC